MTESSANGVDLTKSSTSRMIWTDRAPTKFLKHSFQMVSACALSES